MDYKISEKKFKVIKISGFSQVKKCLMETPELCLLLL